MSEGWLVLFGTIIGGAISALTTLLTERYKNKNTVSIKIREQQEKLYLEMTDALYRGFDAHTLHGRYDLTYFLEYFLNTRPTLVLFGSRKVLKNFKTFLIYIEELHKSDDLLTTEQIDLISQNILNLINILRNDLQVNKNEFLDED